MNSLKRVITAIVFTLLFIPAVVSQPMQQQQQRMQPKEGEDFTTFQINMITEQLRLEESKVEPFKTLYTEYTKKMDEFQAKPQRRNNSGGNTPNQQNAGVQRARPTTEEVEAQILESFEITEKSNALKREYYYKFKEILTPQQILRMYNTERRLRERMLSESNRRNEGGNRPSDRNRSAQGAQ